MIDLGKKNLIGIQVNIIDYEAAVEKIITAAKEKKSTSVTALAVHGVMTGALDATHRYRLNQFDLALPDGQPVRWGLNLLHRAKLTDRVYGPTLTLKVCERVAQERLPIYLYGSQPSVLNAFAENLTKQFPGLIIAGKQPSQFRQITSDEKQKVIEDIQNSGAVLTFVGLGCPRQEVWIYEYRNFLSMPLLAVGASFDFHAGTLPQAPPSLQKVGLEWVFRLFQEPKRLWQRYLFLNPLYLTLVALQRLGLKDFDQVNSTPPVKEIGYG